MRSCLPKLTSQRSFIKNLTMWKRYSSHFVLKVFCSICITVSNYPIVHLKVLDLFEIPLFFIEGLEYCPPSPKSSQPNCAKNDIQKELHNSWDKEILKASSPTNKKTLCPSSKKLVDLLLLPLA